MIKFKHVTEYSEWVEYLLVTKAITYRRNVPRDLIGVNNGGSPLETRVELDYIPKALVGYELWTKMRIVRSLGNELIKDLSHYAIPYNGE